MKHSTKGERFLALAFYGKNDEVGISSSTVNLKVGGFPSAKLAAKALAGSKARFGTVERYGKVGCLYIKSHGKVEKV